MYQILCDGYVLYDPRDDELIVKDKRCKIGSNICGEASFSILANHPHYNKLKKLRSVFEIRQDNDTIFRGRMTEDSRDFDNIKIVDLEGAMAYLNDSVIRPFSFPGDFPDAASAGNVVEYFFRWLIEQHNAQVQEFQRFKVGKVTVKDPNNYLSRSNTDYAKTWATVKDKLFGSSLGGYLCIRYEADGNYLDYLADYADEAGNKIVNSQVVEFGRNLLDFNNESDGKQTYSAVVPLGKKDGDSAQLNIASLPDGNVTADIVKKGDTLYSRKAVEEYGWIVAPTADTTFEDVTIAANLRDRGVAFLESKSAGFVETITMTALDLHLSDDEIEAFRVYKYVSASSDPHGASGVYPLSELDIDMDNLQNTKITVGETKGGLTDKTADTAQKVTEIKQNYTTKTEVMTSILEAEDSIRLEVQTQINGVEDSVAAIELTTDSINARVSDAENNLLSMEATVRGLTTRVSTTEGDLDNLEVYTSIVEQTANKINWIVESGTSAADFTMTDRAISLVADNINLTGYVTFANLATEGQTLIDGGNIVANSLAVSALEADSLGDLYFNSNLNAPYMISRGGIQFNAGSADPYSAIVSKSGDVLQFQANGFRFYGWNMYHPVVNIGGVDYPLISAYNIKDYL